MKKFKFLLVALVSSVILIVVGQIKISHDQTPDAGLMLFYYFLGAIIICSFGFTADLFVLASRSAQKSTNPNIRKRKTLIIICSAVLIITLAYGVFVLAVT